MRCTTDSQRPAARRSWAATISAVPIPLRCASWAHVQVLDHVALQRQEGDGRICAPKYRTSALPISTSAKYRNIPPASRSSASHGIATRHDPTRRDATKICVMAAASARSAAKISISGNDRDRRPNTGAAGKRDERRCASWFAARLRRTPEGGGDCAACAGATNSWSVADRVSESARDCLRLFVVLGRGDVIGGFEIQRDLRSGARGVVYEAVQVGVGRVVALRVLDLRLSRGHDPAFVERFRHQEWPEHPHIAAVIEAGEWDHGLFVAMQLIRGDTIAELLARGDLDQSTALAALTEIASALDSAHQRGLAHGWVSPQAVLIDEDGWSWLVNFGLFPGTATPAADRTAFAALVRTCLGKRSVPRGSWETASALMQAVSAHLAAQPARDSGRLRRRRRRAPPPQ